MRHIKIKQINRCDMDAGTLTRVRQMREQLAHFQRAGMNGRGSDIYNLAEGAVIQYVNRAAVLNPPVLPVGQIGDVMEAARHSSVLPAVVAYVKQFLAWLAASGLGPTHVARRIYLLSVLLAGAWHWVAPRDKRRIGGVRDGWNWDAGVAFGDETSRSIWLTHVVADHIGDIAAGMNVGPVLALERTGMRWNEEEQRAGAAAVLAAGGGSAFAAAWRTWFAGRQADGSATLPAAGAAEIVNLNLQLETGSGTLPAFVDADKWTALKLPMKPAKQTYLTYFWRTVRGTGLSVEDEEDLNSAAAVFFPDETERAAEVAEVVSITAGLTDKEKCTAEWWAGGPGTIAPPGMCVWWWKEFMESVYGGADAEGICVSSLLDLGIHLFEASRLVWGLKAQFTQARPIQEIRRRYAGMALTGYDGEAVSGELWMPYQETDFVSPPFADFPSGHSCFSQMAATVMTAWFGALVPTGIRRRTDLNLMSPMFAGAGVIEGPFHKIVIAGGKSRVQTGVVPAAEVVLEWNTWQDMANSSGFSRLYGGIHCMSAHTSSQHIANEAHERIGRVWGIRR
jgi:hypothetical protein